VELENLRELAGQRFQRERDSQISIADQGQQFDPTTVRLPLNYERARVLAAEAAEQYVTTRRAMTDFLRSTEQASTNLGGRINDASTAEERRALERQRDQLQLDAHLLRAWMGVSVNEAELQADALERDLAGDNVGNLQEAKIRNLVGASYHSHEKKVFDLVKAAKAATAAKAAPAVNNSNDASDHTVRP
jgi:hypothetical protein